MDRIPGINVSRRPYLKSTPNLNSALHLRQYPLALSLQYSALGDEYPYESETNSRSGCGRGDFPDSRERTLPPAWIHVPLGIRNTATCSLEAECVNCPLEAASRIVGSGAVTSGYVPQTIGHHDYGAGYLSGHGFTLTFGP